jgi:hypothetical protein
MVGDGGGGVSGLLWGRRPEGLRCLGPSRRHLIVGRSIEEDYRQIMLNRRQSEVWSAMDQGENFVDLAGPS